MVATSIKKKHEQACFKATCKAAIKISKRVCEIYQYIKFCQPKITKINTGMGTWSFCGEGIAICTEEGCEGDEIKIDDVVISDIVRQNTENDWYKFNVNKALYEIVLLIDTLCDMSELNCSSWQDGFNEEGIIFIHSETSNQNNPFAIPNKEYQMDSDYYRGLIKQKVPICFIDESKK